MAASLHVASIPLSVLSSIFFIIGVAGFSTEDMTIQSIAWITSSKSGDDFYFGLSTLYIYSTDTFFATGDPNVSIRYSGCDASFCNHECDASFCDHCDVAGKVAFAFTLIALFCSMTNVGLSVALASRQDKSLIYYNLAAAVVAGVLSLIAVSVFMGDCYNAINGTGLLAWGPGAALVLVGMLFRWIVVALQGFALMSFQPGQTTAPPAVSNSHYYAGVNSVPNTPQYPVAVVPVEAEAHYAVEVVPVAVKSEYTPSAPPVAAPQYQLHAGVVCAGSQ
jgi:hypothetical protein